LRGIDARAPVKAVQGALGGDLFTPRTPAGNLRRLAVVAWPVSIFGVCMLLTSLDRVHDLHKLLMIIGVSGAMWSGAFGMAMLLFAVTTLLKRRWEQGAEPALLALLPGLGRHAPMHRSVLRAMFVKPFSLCIALWAMMVICEYLLHLGALAYALTTLIVLGMGAATAMSLLCVFAGRSLGKCRPDLHHRHRVRVDVREPPAGVPHADGKAWRCGRTGRVGAGGGVAVVRRLDDVACIARMASIPATAASVPFALRAFCSRVSHGAPHRGRISAGSHVSVPSSRATTSGSAISAATRTAPTAPRTPPDV
jgi:hypothetical protein